MSATSDLRGLLKVNAGREAYIYFIGKRLNYPINSRLCSTVMGGCVLEPWSLIWMDGGFMFAVGADSRACCLDPVQCPRYQGEPEADAGPEGTLFLPLPVVYIAMGKLQMSICKVLSIIKLSASPLQWSTTCRKYAAFASPVLSWPGPIVARFGARRWFKLLLCLVPGGGELTEEPRWRRSLEKVPPDPGMSIH